MIKSTSITVSKIDQYLQNFENSLKSQDSTLKNQPENSEILPKLELENLGTNFKFTKITNDTLSSGNYDFDFDCHYLSNLENLIRNSLKMPIILPMPNTFLPSKIKENFIPTFYFSMTHKLISQIVQTQAFLCIL